MSRRPFFPSTLAALCLATSLSCFAQYEQLLQEPDPATVPAVAETPPPPPPRLISPELHALPIEHLDRSVDGDYLLTADRQFLRLWNRAERVTVFTLEADRNKEIHFAAFTADGHGLLVQVGSELRHYPNLPDDESFTSTYASTSSTKRFHRPTNTLFAAEIKSANPRLVHLARLQVGDPLRFTSETINLYNTHPADTALRFHPANGLTVNAEGTLVGFHFLGEVPFAIVAPSSAKVVATVPSDKHPQGLMPSGQVLTANYTNGIARFAALATSINVSIELLRLSTPHEPYLRFPAQLGDPLRIHQSNGTTLFDFATGRSSALLTAPGRRFDAFVFDRPASPDSAFATLSRTVGVNREVLSTHLERFNLTSGVSFGPWNPEVFKPTQLTARPDDFDFIVQRGSELRRVTFNEAGVHSTPIRYDRADVGGLVPFYHRNTDAWNVVLTGPAAVAAPANPTDTTAPYAARGLGHANYRRDDGNYGRFNPVLASTIDRSGTLIALHHGNAVQVVDLTSGEQRHTFYDGHAHTQHQFTTPHLTFAPDGTGLVFSFATKTTSGIVETTTHFYNLPTGDLRWTRRGLSGPYAFPPDDSLLAAGFQLVYAETGENSAGINPHRGSYDPDTRLTYNAAGSLLATYARGRLTTVALPSGETVQSIQVEHPVDDLTFIGSDRFLLTTSTRDEALRLYDLSQAENIAEIHLFESPQKWLVRHPATGLFASETSLQRDLKFAVGNQITPLESYFDEFYRPRLLGSLVKGLAPRPAIPLNALRHAPKLTLRVAGPSTRGLTVEDEFESFEIPTPEVTLQLDASCEGAAVTDLRVYHNGKLVAGAGATRGLFVEDDEDAPPADAQTFTKSATHTFTLTPGKNRFRAVAINAQGTESVPDEVIVYSGATAPVDDTAGIALHVVTVGINTYQNPAYNLNYARADATAVATVLEERLGQLFTRAHHYALYDAEATRENILATLETVRREAGPRDVFVFYYAGHGVMSQDDDPEFYLAPHEITQLYGERRLLRQLGIPGSQLLAYSRDIAAQKQLFILDACQSAGALKALATRGAVEERAIAQLARSTGTHWLTATASEQFATEFAELGHGAFTKVLLDALNGAADAGDGIVTVNELKAYLEATVPEVTAATKGEAQYPVTYGYGQDFPLTIVPAATN
ncbi:caspase family protein [Actomonas aquatica]|uniref:Caspase family protein n=1 Tax=Actomonas aquatica TaxID=2866162 RepID=A0ABZ1C5X3_9BACT|nr:caspase family protein [Opitutus sp. WL0086]WRQ87131.1 caspase family protein [Opitutus sp. WL0086]